MPNYDWPELIAATCKAVGWEIWDDDYPHQVYPPCGPYPLDERSLDDVAAVQEKAGITEGQWRFEEADRGYVVLISKRLGCHPDSRPEAEWLATARAQGVKIEDYEVTTNAT